MAEKRFENMTKKALDAGALNANIIKTEDIVTDEAFRDICATNQCGIYGKCWMCPPDVGDIHKLMASVRTYGYALVYQKVYPLEDSFDIEGMQEAKDDFRDLIQRMRRIFSDGGMLHLGAGGCGVCKVCAKREDLPCRFPNLAVASLEGYGINVSKLAASAGMKYINGQNTVTYFGAVLFSEPDM